jgi:hypothetical protein
VRRELIAGCQGAETHRVLIGGVPFGKLPCFRIDRRYIWSKLLLNFVGTFWRVDEYRLCNLFPGALIPAKEAKLSWLGLHREYL